ncbi:MAG: 30S ribosomal protein S4 [Bacteroidetes bacterium]|nr:30S ribosomal protein S4 [Bacteroidota bacterium]
MARYTGPKAKISRKFNEPILGGEKVLRKKSYPPGQHGKVRKKKSEYAIQSAEKQKAKYIYGLLEKQFSNLFKKASRKKGITGEVLLQLLESRLDNLVFRLGIAPTRRAARQLVNHGHIQVNGKDLNIPSAHIKVGSLIEVRDKSKNLTVITENINTYSEDFSWLEWDKARLVGKFISTPERENIPEKINEQSIVELYSK